MEQNLPSLVKDWQTALAGVVVIILMGFRWYFSAKKEIRNDEGAEADHAAHLDTIKMLREENERLWKIAEYRQTALLNAESKFRDLCEECKKRGVPVPKVP